LPKVIDSLITDNNAAGARHYPGDVMCLSVDGTGYTVAQVRVVLVGPARPLLLLYCAVR
jgi:hypothetical protein